MAEDSVPPGHILVGVIAAKVAWASTATVAVTEATQFVAEDVAVTS